jgi:hypothetical protein
VLQARLCVAVRLTLVTMLEEKSQRCDRVCRPKTLFILWGRCLGLLMAMLLACDSRGVGRRVLEATGLYRRATGTQEGSGPIARCPDEVGPGQSSGRFP